MPYREEGRNTTPADMTAPTSQPRSLRARYLRVAAILAVLLLASALASSWYIRNVNQANTASLVLRDELTALLGKTRDEIWAADATLNAMLISPQPEHERIILERLSRAHAHLDNIGRHDLGELGKLSQELAALRAQLEKLSARAEQLIEMRKDTNWVYPILPYISRKLLEPNNTFETAVAQALNEIALQDGQPYASALYGRFAEVRSLWRQKILNFRAVVIRFAGLRDIETTPQEINIGQYHEVIEQKLDGLEALKKAGKLGLESEEALEAMREASRTWQRNWESVKKLRSANIWRGDVQFLKKNLRPVQHRVLELLGNMEQTIITWSESNTARVQNAANQLSHMLWTLTGIALLFMVLVYVMMDRSILGPIARIADALASEGQTANYQLEDQSSREISTLIQAFNTMRHQIHERQMALEHQALHDALTGLPNRMLLNDRLEQAIHLMRRAEQPVAVLLLDLDRFKEVNDALGHQVGDELLQQVGQRLEDCMRDSDTIARLGGDEFAIVAPNTSSEQARIFAEKIATTINQVFSIQQQNLYVGASIGVATFPEHGEDAINLIKHADIAMYVAKQNNLDVFVYEKQHDLHSVDQLALVGDLHKEIETPQHLTLFYQPLIDLLSREVIAVEALLRWQHPQLGFISPERIIGLAEHTGLIGPLSRWVINTAISDCAECRFGDQGARVAINLSAWNLQDPDLPTEIQNALDSLGLPPDRLSLEITESAMMNDPVRAREVLHQLSAMGVDLAVDDFGTGFSSLGYLKMLPVNSLKIDKSFVIDMLDDENDAIIVRSTIELAHNLGLKVVAEGVENQATLLQLRQHRCDLAQGFHISRPLSKPELLAWYQKYRLQAVH